MRVRGLKDIFFLIILIFFNNIVSLSETREVPNIIIKDNPKKEVYQIDTIKRRTKPAELNLTVTKIKTEEIPIKIDKKRNIIFADLKEMDEKNIYPLEDLKNLPNPETASGRRALNRLRSKKLDENLEVKRYEINSREKKTRLEVKYKTLPKNLFLVVTDKNQMSPKKIYRAKFSDYNSPKGNSVSIKLWLFGEEMGALTNLVINPSNNSTGNIEIRKNGEYIYPEDAIIQNNLRTVFDISGKPEIFEFEESDTIEIQNVASQGSTAVTSIKNNLGSFYKDRNEYAECVVPGYTLKARIWSDSNKVEFSLQKNSNKDGYVNFKIIHKASDGTLRQEINVEMFINNKSFDKYFSGLISYSTVYDFKYLSKEYDYNSNSYVYPIQVQEGVRVTNFICDILNYNEITPTSTTPIKVRKTWGERGGEQILDDYYNKLESYSTGFNKEVGNKNITAEVTLTNVKVYSNWLYPQSQTTQYFEYNGSYLSYGKNKRRINLKNVAGLTDSYFDSFGVNVIGVVEGLPIKDKNLDLASKNGNKEIIKFSQGDTFYITKKYTNSKFYWVLNGNYVTEENLKMDGAEFKSVYSTYIDGFDYYNIQFKNLELKNYEREYVIEGRDGVYYTSNQITIPRFNPEILINKSISSLEKDIVKYLDISDKFDVNYIRPINLGEIHFNRYDNMGILKDNSTSSPYVSLPENVYLEDEIDKERIDVTLSFKQNEVKKKLEMDNYKNSVISGGGNGEKIYLIISPNEYKKMIQKGGGRKYNLKGGNIKIGINIDKANLTNNPSGIIEENIVSSIKVYTTKVDPSLSVIKFIEKTPLLVSRFFSLLKTDIIYLNQPNDGYNYNNTISLSGDVAQYNYTARKHNYEILDDSGKLIKGFISSNGNGGYWENIDIGNGNTITISQGKDTKTYIALTKWNYEKSKGAISIKHYIESFPETNQYYKFYFELPQLDPYIYYNESFNGETIKKGENIVKNINSTTKEISLGYIALKNYDMGITIQSLGNKADGEGMRIETQIDSLDIIDKATGISSGKKARIKIVDSMNNEILSGKIVGRDRFAKVVLEIPSDLSKVKNYEINSKVGSNVLFDNNRKDYILKIGRNGYWKEIINKIELIGINKLEGSATLKISNLYKEGTRITFETIDYDRLNTSKLKDPVPSGVSLENRMGYGMLKGRSGDRAYIKHNGKIIDIGNLDSTGSTASKNIMLDGGNQIEVQYKNGEFVVNLIKRKLGTQTNELISICLDRANEQVLEFNLTLSIEESWFKIIDKEVLDFGTVVAGSKNLDAKAFMLFETSNSVSYDNIKVELNSYKIPLYPISNPSEKDLEATITYFELKKDSLDNRYRVDVEAKLDTQQESKLGEQKGTAEITIEIKE